MPAAPVLTHCPYCSLQCGMSLHDADGLLRIGIRDFPANRGGLCQKGWTAAAGHSAGPGTGGATSYAGSPEVVRLKAAGVELAILGSARACPGADVIRFTDPGRGVYQKLVVRAGRLAGALLLGDTRTAGTLTQLFDRGAVLPADRASLLIARRDGAAPAPDSPVMIGGSLRSASATASPKPPSARPIKTGPGTPSRSLPERAPPLAAGRARAPSRQS